MNYGSIIQSQYHDMNNLSSLLTSLISSYKILVSAAEELNRITLAKKDDVEDAIDRAQELGEIIDKIIDILHDQTDLYINYSKVKGNFIVSNFPFNDLIKYEIDEYLKYSPDKK